MKILDTQGKATMSRVIKSVVMVATISILMALFMCCLLYFTSSTVVLGWNSAGILLNSKMEILGNPITALLIGILSTAIIQQPVFILTVLVSMVTNNSLHPVTAVPIIMGMNIGSTFTPTMFSLTLFYRRQLFKQGGTMVLLPNIVSWLTVLILLPLEFATGFLYQLSKWLAECNISTVSTYQEYGFLYGVLKPITRHIIQFNELISDNNSSDGTENNRIVLQCSGLLKDVGVNCTVAGFTVLLISVILCLFFFTLLINVLVREDKYRDSVQLVPSTIPKEYCAYFKGCLLIMIGCIVTIFVQDNVLVITAVLPIVATGFIRNDKAYPLIMGSNVGSAVAALLQLLSESSVSPIGLQIAFCHLFFNLSSLVLFYIIPFSSKIPMQFAEVLGKKVEMHRWFMIALCVGGFFVLPLVTYGLALAGHYYVISFHSIIIFILLITSSVALMQMFTPSCLPLCMRSWTFLPPFLRSLESYEYGVSKSFSYLKSTTVCYRPPVNMSPNQSAIKDSHLSVLPKDVYVSVPVERPSCCCSWFTSRKLYTKYSLRAPTQTSTPKVPPKPTRTPRLLSYNRQDYETQLSDSPSKLDPRELLNFGTLGFEDDTYSSSSEEDLSEDPSDFTRTNSSSSCSSVYDDNQQLLNHAHL